MFQNIVYKKRNALQRKSDVQTDHHLAWIWIILEGIVLKKETKTKRGESIHLQIMKIL